MTPGGSLQAPEHSMTIDSVLGEMRDELRAAGIESADQEAVWLLAHATGISPLVQTVNRERVLFGEEVSRVRQLIARRTAREPLQYILGNQEFCGLDFEVNRSVLIPRPETELLPQAVARRLSADNAPFIVDVGTGSGCLGVVLARMFPRGKVWAIDLSSSAIETGKRNAERHGVSNVTWLQGDLLAPLSALALERRISAIVTNPPYISTADWMGLQPEVRLYEPYGALVSGPRGTELHERLVETAVPYLAPGGILIMELGQGQSESLVDLVNANWAYRSVETLCDDNGIERVLIAERTTTDGHNG
ncbi:MAG TPA: peptide chain release factor N(5)-glutamine methyltransferase [Nitrospira sp.]|nr:peptide chain release factor N(5)-glutamine methyltransferase [Nitrospira sp.]